MAKLKFTPEMPKKRKWKVVESKFKELKILILNTS